MISLSGDNQVDVIETFNSTARYLDDLLKIDNPYFKGTANQTYRFALQLNKANVSDTKAPILDLHQSISNHPKLMISATTLHKLYDGFNLCSSCCRYTLYFASKEIS